MPQTVDENVGRLELTKPASHRTTLLHGTVSLMNLSVALALATELSEHVQGTTSPNPPVGCVLLDASGVVVGQGATEPPGGAHAEVVAIRSAGPMARGATAVTTLEPCNHSGRTGPCSLALIEAGVAHVHYAATDPSAAGSGGAQRLREAGIIVTTSNTSPYPLKNWLDHQQRIQTHTTE